nr:MAG TPA: hypothetical protein [Caudoviricetes sp.]
MSGSVLTHTSLFYVDVLTVVNYWHSPKFYIYSIILKWEIFLKFLLLKRKNIR